jgi:hypothetical protein
MYHCHKPVDLIYTLLWNLQTPNILESLFTNIQHRQRDSWISNHTASTCRINVLQNSKDVCNLQHILLMANAVSELSYVNICNLHIYIYIYICTFVIYLCRSLEQDSQSNVQISIFYFRLNWDYAELLKACRKSTAFILRSCGWYIHTLKAVFNMANFITSLFLFFGLPG